MSFKLPLTERRRYDADKKRRYWANPDERLKRVNEARRLRGAPEIASLAELGTRARSAPRIRDDSGRFVADGGAV